MAKKKPKREGPGQEMVDASELRQGPIQYQQLDPVGLALARFTYKKIGRLFQPTFEQWELGFLRELHPNRELALWVRMAYGLERYLARHPDEDERNVFKDLVSLSVGNAADTRRKRELTALCTAVTDRDLEAAVAEEME